MSGQQYIGTGRLGATIAGAVAYTGTAGASSAIDVGVTKVRVLVTTDAYVTTDGTTPSTTNGAYVVGLSPEYFTVNAGQVVKAVQVASAGSLNVVELA